MRRATETIRVEVFAIRIVPGELAIPDWVRRLEVALIAGAVVTVVAFSVACATGRELLKRAACRIRTRTSRIANVCRAKSAVITAAIYRAGAAILAESVGIATAVAAGRLVETVAGTVARVLARKGITTPIAASDAAIDWAGA